MKKHLALALILFLSVPTFSQPLKITVHNPSDIIRNGEMAEIPWNVIEKNMKPGTASLIVLDAKQQQVPCQIVFAGEGKVQCLIFPVTLNAGQTAPFTIQEGSPEEFTPLVYGRFVPERLDDFAWENNRVAYRVYGPALEASGAASSGIDLWTKRTEALIIDKWYDESLNRKLSYHQDRGEGMDFYDVGRTLGAGASAPYVNDSLWFCNDFISYKILDKGPLRFTFRLEYAPYDVAGKQVRETRIISLDANDNLNKVTVRYSSPEEKTPVAAGVVIRNKTGEKSEVSAEKGYIAYAEPEVTNKGIIYTGVVSTEPFLKTEKTQGHLLAIGTCLPGESYSYYSGGGWSKGGFETPEQWFTYIRDFAARKRQPLIIRYGH